ncbi:hypothetical protein PV328_007829 [Microctonus aethiopoides]|uniref:Uncharacterized protein n=1 Tax=Microctonus aethiopoides TaxID=144406 RepID=A0AA39C9Q2_9HYME|nr:hypothetical protein PV328_007829 [Microctonus aethiopoides]
MNVNNHLEKQNHPKRKSPQYHEIMDRWQYGNMISNYRHKFEEPQSNKPKKLANLGMEANKLKIGENLYFGILKTKRQVTSYNLVSASQDIQGQRSGKSLICFHSEVECVFDWAITENIHPKKYYDPTATDIIVSLTTTIPILN